MANAPPSATIHSGIPAGKVRPSSIPVMAAEPSPMLPRVLSHRSAATAADHAVPTVRNNTLHQNTPALPAHDRTLAHPCN